MYAAHCQDTHRHTIWNPSLNVMVLKLFSQSTCPNPTDTAQKFLPHWFFLASLNTPDSLRHRPAQLHTHTPTTSLFPSASFSRSVWICVFLTHACCDLRHLSFHLPVTCPSFLVLSHTHRHTKPSYLFHTHTSCSHTVRSPPPRAL